MIREFKAKIDCSLETFHNILILDQLHDFQGGIGPNVDIEKTDRAIELYKSGGIFEKNGTGKPLKVLEDLEKLYPFNKQDNFFLDSSSTTTSPSTTTDNRFSKLCIDYEISFNNVFRLQNSDNITRAGILSLSYLVDDNSEFSKNKKNNFDILYRKINNIPASNNSKIPLELKTSDTFWKLKISITDYSIKGQIAIPDGFKNIIENFKLPDLDHLNKIFNDKESAYDLLLQFFNFYIKHIPISEVKKSKNMNILDQILKNIMNSIGKEKPDKRNIEFVNLKIENITKDTNSYKEIIFSVDDDYRNNIIISLDEYEKTKTKTKKISSTEIQKLIIRFTKDVTKNKWKKKKKLYRLDYKIKDIMNKSKNHYNYLALEGEGPKLTYKTINNPEDYILDIDTINRYIATVLFTEKEQKNFYNQKLLRILDYHLALNTGNNHKYNPNNLIKDYEDLDISSCNYEVPFRIFKSPTNPNNISYSVDVNINLDAVKRSEETILDWSLKHNIQSSIPNSFNINPRTNLYLSHYYDEAGSDVLHSFEEMSYLASKYDLHHRTGIVNFSLYEKVLISLGANNKFDIQGIIIDEPGVKSNYDTKNNVYPHYKVRVEWISSTKKKDLEDLCTYISLKKDSGELIKFVDNVNLHEQEREYKPRVWYKVMNDTDKDKPILRLNIYKEENPQSPTDIVLFNTDPDKSSIRNLINILAMGETIYVSTAVNTHSQRISTLTFEKGYNLREDFVYSVTNLMPTIERFEINDNSTTPNVLKWNLLEFWDPFQILIYKDILTGNNSLLNDFIDKTDEINFIKANINNYYDSKGFYKDLNLYIQKILFQNLGVKTSNYGLPFSIYTHKGERDMTEIGTNNSLVLSNGSNNDDKLAKDRLFKGFQNFYKNVYRDDGAFPFEEKKNIILNFSLANIISIVNNKPYNDIIAKNQIANLDNAFKIPKFKIGGFWAYNQTEKPINRGNESKKKLENMVTSAEKKKYRVVLQDSYKIKQTKNGGGDNQNGGATKDQVDTAKLRVENTGLSEDILKFLTKKEKGNVKDAKVYLKYVWTFLISSIRSVYYYKYNKPHSNKSKSNDMINTYRNNFRAYVRNRKKDSIKLFYTDSPIKKSNFPNPQTITTSTPEIDEFKTGINLTNFTNLYKYYFNTGINPYSNLNGYSVSKLTTMINELYQKTNGQNYIGILFFMKTIADLNQVISTFGNQDIYYYGKINKSSLEPTNDYFITFDKAAYYYSTLFKGAKRRSLLSSEVSYYDKYLEYNKTFLSDKEIIKKTLSNISNNKKRALKNAFIFSVPEVLEIETNIILNSKNNWKESWDNFKMKQLELGRIYEKVDLKKLIMCNNIDILTEDNEVEEDVLDKLEFNSDKSLYYDNEIRNSDTTNEVIKKTKIMKVRDFGQDKFFCYTSTNIQHLIMCLCSSEALPVELTQGTIKTMKQMLTESHNFDIVKSKFDREKKECESVTKIQRRQLFNMNRKFKKCENDVYELRNPEKNPVILHTPRPFSSQDLEKGKTSLKPLSKLTLNE